MQSIDDIKFDIDYSYPSTFFLLLYNHQLHSIPIELSHADLLTFIRRFQNLFDCQQYVDNNLQKMITLFINNNQFLDWDRNRNSIQPNLCKIFIYCNTFLGYCNMKSWNGPYHEKIRDIFMEEDLNYHLLYAGIDHVRTICAESDEDNGLHEKFQRDGKRICLALGDYFGSRATRLSIETTDNWF
jgi:hypothetical protein